MKVKNINFQLKTFHQCIQLLHNNSSITHNELANSLGVSPSGLTNKINRYLKTEPPLIEKERSGKCVFYSLTKDGAKYYNDNINMEKEESISPETKTALISYILASSQDRDNPYASILRRTEVSTISDLLDINEFLFLSMELGILSEDFTSMENFLDDIHSTRDIEKGEWVEEVYNKFKRLIDLDIEREKSLFKTKKI